MSDLRSLPSVDKLLADAAALIDVYGRPLTTEAIRFTLDAARAFNPGADFPPGNAQVILEVDGQPASVRGEAKALEKS